MRQLATIRKIKDIQPIKDADAIECAHVDGWKVVVKKGEFEVGDLCVYVEIDSFLPESDERFSFLMKSTREFEGERGHVLRTVKLRGQLSQGLVLPLSILGPRENTFTIGEGCIGADVTLDLGIKKWEAPVPAELAGQVKGMFPSRIRKTDQERCQNLTTEIFVDNANASYEVTIKLDGTSATFYHIDGELGACSRNLDLKINEENKDNTFVRMLNDSGLATALPQLGNIAVQGELMGPGIQGNPEKLARHMFFIFDVQDVGTGMYLTGSERTSVYRKLLDLGVDAEKVQHVPVVAYSANLLDTLGITNVEQLLKFAEGPSLNAAVREGVVFKRTDGGFSFKAISNAFLLKQKE